MHSIDPGEAWGKGTVIGGSQTEHYEPLYARLHPEGNTITRWRLTDAERQRLIDGADLYISILQFGNPLQPLAPFIGESDDG